MAPTQFLGDVPLYPRSTYVAELRDKLAAGANEPARSRLLLIPIYLGVIVAVVGAVALGWVPWIAMPVVSIVLGVTFGLMTFVAHELLHGGIVRNKTVQHVVGWFAFMPFALSPRLWIAWHNGNHHANTQLPDDPDSYATIERYRARSATRFSVDSFSLGGRRWRGVLSLVLGFTVQSVDQLTSAQAHGHLSRRTQRLAYAETGLALAVWAGVAVLVGPLAFLFVWVLPLAIGNACVMAFILTNHSLSPRLPINDPLVGGLSVTTSRFVEWITLGFGFHVEHHLFPAMSSRHAREVRGLVEARWPDRYQSMPLRDALSQLHNTARVYKNATTLYDPKTGAEFPTLMPATATRARVRDARASGAATVGVRGRSLESQM
jgi:fatty acid desaturase